MTRKKILKLFYVGESVNILEVLIEYILALWIFVIIVVLQDCI